VVGEGPQNAGYIVAFLVQGFGGLRTHLACTLSTDVQRA